MTAGTGRLHGNVAKLCVGLCLAIGGLTAASVVRANFGGALPARDTGFSAGLSPDYETPSTDAVITLGPDGRDVRLSGELTEGVAARLKHVLDENPRIERIHLTSEGGFVDEGDAIGDAIAARGLVAYVPDYCVSACTLAFIRGRERLMLADSRIGFHAPYEIGLFGRDVQADSAPERASYIAAGIAAEFVDAALKVASDDIWIPEASRLLQAGVATGLVDRRHFPDSTLDGGADVEHARAALLRNFAPLRDLAASTPGAIDRIAAWYLDAYRSGMSETAAVDGIHRLAAGFVSHGLRATDDVAIVPVSAPRPLP